MSLLTAWSPFFQSSARMRGRGYQVSNRVRRLEPQDDELVRAEVQGRRPYTVVIRQDGGRAEAQCTCPRFEAGAYCKHIWATLLDLQHNQDGPGASAEQLAGLRVRAPKARKRPNGERLNGSAEPEWMGRLSLLRPSAQELARQGAEVLPTQRQVCYVVLPERSSAQQALVIEVRQRSPLAAGWSRSKPLKISVETLLSLGDPVDRELCALLVGAQPCDPEQQAYAYGRGGSSACRLPPGAWRSLLQRMIATGRCFIDLDEESQSAQEQPLVWAGDPPWVLWMVGQEGEEGELLIDLELRRGSQRMPIERPTLVLGGPDGLVIWQGQAAPLDDRDAIRWAVHFRDEYQRHNQPKPLRVQRTEVGRFLDRLYMLPQLPEIDLPEGLGRTPRHVDPVPHLDLFHPGSAQAGQLMPASARHQVLGRVWFDYDQRRVSPAQPGRFVTLGPLNVEAGPVAESTPTEPDEAGSLPTCDETAQACDEAAGAAWLEEQASQAGQQEGTQGAAELGADSSSPDALEPEAGNGLKGQAEGDGQAEAASLDGAAAEEEAPPPEGVLIRRDRRAEHRALAQLAAQGFRPLSSAGPDALVLPVKQVPQAVASLLAQGWRITADQRVVRYPGTPSFSITSGLDWFELRGSLQYQGQDGQVVEVPLPQILAAAKQGRQFIELGDGTQGLLPEQWLQEHSLLVSLGRLERDHLRFKRSQAAVLDVLLSQQELVQADELFEQIRRRLHQFRGIQPLSPAETFRGTLRPYQRQGLGWMAFLRWFGVGGILADDMGLGKTIQVLAMLQARRLGLADHAEGIGAAGNGRGGAGDGQSAKGAAFCGPSLVVAPRSVVFNWVDEATRFTPDLRVQAYTGSDREALRAAFDEHDVIITSYGLLRRDIQQLREHAFDYVILDEAQAIKNPASQAAKAARLLRANHRLALTGTPVENHLGDLWSIFEFLNPGLLGSSTRFAQLVRVSSQTASASSDEGGSASRSALIEQISRVLRPFILRRTKKQVLQDLPEKTEQTIMCQMEGPQKQVYEQLRQYYRQHLLTHLDAQAWKGQSLAGGRAGMMVLEALLRLRQAACHPGLIDAQRAGEPAAKLEVLLELLPDIIEEGSKALVFSQFTSMLDLVRQRLDQQGIRYAYLDGQTRDRREVVHRFQQDPDLPVFLISLKSGGFGINLTAAEYVFILDPWWNPAVEQQAIDRTHRIGQTRRVFAYRLICQDTIEQRILTLQQRKRQIADAVVGGQESVLQSLTREDLEHLLS